MNQDSILIRPAEAKDSYQLLQLMIQLAEFEHYIDDFKVTEKELYKRLFENKDFMVLVAENTAGLMGMLVYYDLPFSYDLKPWVYIKELFVSSEFRSMGIGKKLMQALASKCQANGCSKIRWDVLRENINAKNFYQSLGAVDAKEWSLFGLNEAAINELAN